MSSAPYDAIASEFASLRKGLQAKERDYLTLLLGHLPAGSTVLDLGCGTGQPIARHISVLGHRVVGVDASSALLEFARLALPGQRWIHARLEDVEFEEGIFSAVVCWDSLFHLPRAAHEGVIRKIHRWLTPGGRLMLSSGALVEEDGKGFTDTMFGREFYYDSLTPAALASTLERSGFDILLSEICTPPDGGKDKGKRAMIAEKRVGA